MNVFRGCNSRYGNATAKLINRFSGDRLSAQLEEEREREREREREKEREREREREKGGFLREKRAHSNSRKNCHRMTTGGGGGGCGRRQTK
jgi:hypothetical protein